MFMSLSKNHIHLKRHVLNLADPSLVAGKGHFLTMCWTGCVWPMAFFYPTQSIQLLELALNKAMIFGKETTEHFVCCLKLG